MLKPCQAAQQQQLLGWSQLSLPCRKKPAKMPSCTSEGADLVKYLFRRPGSTPNKRNTTVVTMLSTYLESTVPKRVSKSCGEGRLATDGTVGQSIIVR